MMNTSEARVSFDKPWKYFDIKSDPNCANQFNRSKLKQKVSQSDY